MMNTDFLIKIISGIMIISILGACDQNNHREDIMTSTDMEQQAIEKTIEALFNAISFKLGEEPNMHKLKPLFIDHGILINYNDPEPLMLPVDDFIVHFNRQFSDGLITQLEDREIHSKTEIFGRIAHRVSYYEARFDAGDAEPFAVGVNSIQLMKIGDEWKITSMAWNDDRGEGFSNFAKLN